MLCVCVECVSGVKIDFRFFVVFLRCHQLHVHKIPSFYVTNLQ